MIIERGDAKNHCPDCLGRSPRGGGVPSILVCRNDNCLCHKPLKMEVDDETKTTAKFG